MKIDLCLFSYRSGSTAARMALDLMVLHSRRQGIDLDVLTFGNALIHRSRNEALCCTRADSDVLFVDDDMLPGKDDLLALIDAERPVISALCTTRTEPVQIAAKVWRKETDQFGWLDRVRLEAVVDGPFAPGTAFLLIGRKVVESLREYHLSAKDWVDENARLLSRLHVRSEQRETERLRKEHIRRQLWETQHYLRIFDYPLSDEELQLGEDIALGRKLLNLGIPVSIHGGVAVGHLGEKAYSVLDMLDAPALAVV